MNKMKRSTKRKREEELNRNSGAVEYNEWIKEFNRVFNSRLDKESEDRSIEIVQSIREEKRKSLWDLQANSKITAESQKEK